ncbi:MAG: flagellar export protein FliJ [Verrucomicrobia bacterium]|nr:flagellar export protein FliJ [Verrucomicrobiota bacterium]
MKSFRFTLEAVATVRKRAEGNALESYAQALLFRRRAVTDLEATLQELETAWASLRNALAAGCSAARMAQLRSHSQALEATRESRRFALQQAERAVNQTLQQMLAARQQREVVDKFRGQQRGRHERALARETQKFLDELATQRTTPALAWRTINDPLA